MVGALDGIRQTKGAEEKLENLFYGYELERVSIHLNEIVLPPTYVLESFKKTFGIKHSKKYREIERILRFDHKFEYTYGYYNINHGTVTERYILECATDDEKKVLYWKGFKESIDLQFP